MVVVAVGRVQVGRVQVGQEVGEAMAGRVEVEVEVEVLAAVVVGQVFLPVEAAPSDPETPVSRPPSAPHQHHHYQHHLSSSGPSPPQPLFPQSVSPSDPRSVQR